LVIVAATVSASNVFMNVAAINPTLPMIASSFGASQTQLQWIGDVYPLVLSALLLPAGTLMDRYGRRRFMLLGLGAMAIFQAVTAVSGSAEVMIVARAFTGLSAALVLPATLASISTFLPPQRRDRAVGVWAGGIIIGASLGLVLTILMLELTSWRGVFGLLAGGSALCLVVVAIGLPPSTRGVTKRLDFPGAALSAVSVGGIVAFVNEGPVRGWIDPLTDGFGVAGLICAWAFVLWELRAPAPLLDLRVFANRAMSASAITLIVLFAADFGMFFLVFQERAYVYGDSAMRATLLIIICFVLFLVTASVGGGLAQRWGLRVTMVSAMLGSAAGLGIVATAGIHTDVIVFVVGLNVFWGGVGLAMTPATRGILDALPEDAQGMASAINDVVRELGVAVGIAILGSAFTIGYRHHLAPLLAGLPAGLADHIRRSPATGLAAGTVTDRSDEVYTIVRDSVAVGWQVSLVVGTVLVLLGAVGAWFALPRRKPGPTPAVQQDVAREAQEVESA
jgi:MFS family permease